ncbi:hypothetical protein KY320_01370, partial [Candidatus Woesearchaeota archaeon]|nr:hypothetical protein [Candidatus Woesearchaeota archaeon]
MTEPQLAIFDSHHTTYTPLGWLYSELVEAGLDVVSSDCPCEYEDIPTALPQVVILHPDYESTNCQKSLGRIVEEHPDTRFIVLSASIHDDVFDSFFGIIGTPDNVRYLGQRGKYGGEN